MVCHMPLPTYPAKFASLPELCAGIAAACNAAGLGDAIRLRAELATEELFANTIHYGYGGDSEQPVWLSAHGNPDGLEIEYRDAAAAFDPLAEAPTDIDAPADERGVGGLGRLLVKAIASNSAYRRDDDQNVVSLFFANDAV